MGAQLDFFPGNICNFVLFFSDQKNSNSKNFVYMGLKFWDFVAGMDFDT